MQICLRRAFSCGYAAVDKGGKGTLAIFIQNMHQWWKLLRNHLGRSDKKKRMKMNFFCLLKNVRKFNAAGAVEHLHTSMKKRGDSRKIFLESLSAIDPAGWVSKF